MKLSRTIIPEDSLLHSWLDKWSHSEVFISWQILTGLAIIGVILRRNVCSLEGSVGRIWPNTSVLLVGPSGSGKDTIINPSCNLLDALQAQYVVGRTLEAVKESLTQMGDPAIGYINASELADFLGCKDYQAGLVQTLTDILSGNKEEIDVSLKSDIVKGISRKIYNPTLTMFAGSTAEWLQNMMPDGTMDGGFLPRFVIAAEWSKKEEGIRLIAHPGKYDSPEQRMIVEGGEKIFVAEMMMQKDGTTTGMKIGTKDLARSYKHMRLAAVDSFVAWRCLWQSAEDTSIGLKKLTTTLQKQSSNMPQIDLKKP